MKIAWTTTETLEQATTLAKQCVEADLVACAQISSPITSLYKWKGSVESSTEFRITLKCLDSKLGALKKWVLQNHPYQCPQWVVVQASEISEDYLAWAKGGDS